MVVATIIYNPYLFVHFFFLSLHLSSFPWKSLLFYLFVLFIAVCTDNTRPAKSHALGMRHGFAVAKTPAHMQTYHKRVQFPSIHVHDDNLHASGILCCETMHSTSRPCSCLGSCGSLIVSWIIYILCTYSALGTRLSTDHNVASYPELGPEYEANHNTHHVSSCRIYTARDLECETLVQLQTYKWRHLHV